MTGHLGGLSAWTARSACLAALLLLVGCGSDGAGADGSSEADGGVDDASDRVPDTTVGEGDADELDPLANCPYPTNDGTISLAKIMPPLSWSGAFFGGDAVDLDLHEFHCLPEYEQYDTAVFSISAGWCPSCPSQIEYLASIAGQLEAEGALLVFLETQTADGLPATHADSNSYVDQIIGTGGPGIRVGDGETLPNQMAVNGSTLITSYPAGFVVRRSDMVVIASQSESDTLLPYVDIAADPDSILETTNRNEVRNCGPADEETYERNDTSDEAPVFSENVHFEGGICDSFPDYYRVEIEGSWTIQIDFEHQVGDLDMFVWDDANNRILTDGAGRPVGSNTVNDQEVYQGRGPTTIVIFGYAGATSTYELWLAEIG